MCARRYLFPSMRRNDTGFCVVCEEQGESDYVTLGLIAAGLIAFLGLAVWILYKYRRSVRLFYHADRVNAQHGATSCNSHSVAHAFLVAD